VGDDLIIIDMTASGNESAKFPYEQSVNISPTAHKQGLSEPPRGESGCSVWCPPASARRGAVTVVQVFRGDQVRSSMT
jgi:hypothetical protein